MYPNLASKGVASMEDLTLNSVRRRIVEGSIRRALDVVQWRGGELFHVGMLHVLEPGVIIIDRNGQWLGRLIVSSSPTSVLTTVSLMPWGGSIDFVRTSRCGPGTVGGEIGRCGYSYWIDVEENRDSYFHCMMSAAQWRDLRAWLNANGLNSPEE